MIIINKEIVVVIFASLRARCSRSHPQQRLPPQKKLEKNAEEVKKKIKMNRPVLLVSLMFYPAEPHQHKQEKNKTEIM
jgi:hypothetical protein